MLQSSVDDYLNASRGPEAVARTPVGYDWNAHASTANKDAGEQLFHAVAMTVALAVPFWAAVGYCLLS